MAALQALWDGTPRLDSCSEYRIQTKRIFKRTKKVKVSLIKKKKKKKRSRQAKYQSLLLLSHTHHFFWRLKSLKLFQARKKEIKLYRLTFLEGDYCARRRNQILFPGVSNMSTQHQHHSLHQHIHHHAPQKIGSYVGRVSYLTIIHIVKRKMRPFFYETIN